MKLAALLLNNGKQSHTTWSKPKTALDKLSGVSNWTLHDLRRARDEQGLKWKNPSLGLFLCSTWRAVWVPIIAREVKIAACAFCFQHQSLGSLCFCLLVFFCVYFAKASTSFKSNCFSRTLFAIPDAATWYIHLTLSQVFVIHTPILIKINY